MHRYMASYLSYEIVVTFYTMMTGGTYRANRHRTSGFL